jgi:hypothetical protein
VAAPPPLRSDEVLRVLKTLAPVTADRSVVLVGGQAVFYWASILGVVDDAATDELLASKDIDFEVDESVLSAVVGSLREGDATGAGYHLTHADAASD